MMTERDIRIAAILECAAAVRQFHEEARPPVHISRDEHSVWRAAMLDCLLVAAKFLQHGGRATPSELRTIEQAIFGLLDDLPAPKGE